ncbi:uncharacterized protein TrAtP1_004124 [Trichoderma atroviride]|uniref:Uncharacterized protein n=1 Tax=Hypocrea atroviridis (strain ATCC 20476 / IMI 206040) TaxID=452589 RepID=G9P7G2_HYPAI|nr:uncharacterized protein TRIATDRAFT_311357 [Trichoderma atroviride IMI 206040]EHK40777.1 hypothetical protein TRIATDRAFT_311357 [Trichoderma atroviride IMI 206040]UKZ62892.1 hypothetical protein TrAtP1_004124 [Trichoderma atroviride]
MRLLAAWDDVLPLYSRTYLYQTGTCASPSPSMDTASLLALARGPQLSSAFYFKTSSNLHMHIPLPSNLGRIHGRAMSRLMIQDKPNVVRTDERDTKQSAGENKPKSRTKLVAPL